ncbi:MAG: hypothetical protein J6K32_04765 [Clostridia bacterium]|nr:hypothetical protein [Clostridia bacterium]
MKRILCSVMLLILPALLSGCGGQEIESSLFVIAMAVDPAPDGTLTVTVKALSGTQETGGAGQTGGTAPDAGAQEQASAAEQSEPGYIVLSATAPSCLRALSLLSATTPRTLNLSQLQEVVLSRTLAQTDAALPILREIHSMYRANSGAIVVVTPDNAGDFIRRQHALLGVRLSQYLQVLFESLSRMDTIPPRAQLASVIAAMESGTRDAAAVYAAGNAFDSSLVLPGTPELDRLPGHLPRTSPAENEYLGSAIFSGGRMTGTLTGSETALLCLITGEARTRSPVIGSTQYKVNLPTRVRRYIGEDGTLCVHIRMNLTRIAGDQGRTAQDVAAQIERTAVSLLQKLQAADCDAAGYGAQAIRGYLTTAQWERSEWADAYRSAPVRVTADVRIL